MRAAIFHSPGRISIETCDPPRPGPDHVVVRVRRCGICGSDVAMTDDVPVRLRPGPFGHEYAGEIVELGSAVSHLKVGQRVACQPAAGCGACAGCRSGNPFFCERPTFATNGGFGDFAAVPAKGAILLPDAVSFAEGALVEPMACGLHAVRMAGVGRGMSVLVLGVGTMALAVVYWARRAGAGRIIVASRSARNTNVAMAMGADAFYSFDADGPAALDQLLGAGADIVAECAGAPGMIDRAITHVRPQGTVVSLGMCQVAEPILPVASAFKEVRLLFPLAYSYDEFVETVRAFDADPTTAAAMVSDVIALTALPAAIADLRSGARKSLKVQVDMDMGDN